MPPPLMLPPLRLAIHFSRRHATHAAYADSDVITFVDILILSLSLSIRFFDTPPYNGWWFYCRHTPMTYAIRYYWRRRRHYFALCCVEVCLSSLFYAISPQRTPPPNFHATRDITADAMPMRLIRRLISPPPIEWYVTLTHAEAPPFAVSY